MFLYPAEGGLSPRELVSSAHLDGSVNVFGAKVSWFSDGSGFLFIGGTVETDWRPSLLAYDGTDGAVSLLVPAPEGTAIYGAAISPDASKIVYCLRDDDGPTNLRLIDLDLASPTDVALTTDGKSCAPSF